MCECLLEGTSEVIERDALVEVHATYKLGLDPIDSYGITPRIDIATNVQVTEDEI